MKVLIIKPSSFGDIIHALPCAATLKKIYHNCDISWVVFKMWTSVVRICPDIDKIIPWDRERGLVGFFETLKKLSEEEYDLIIDLQGLLRSALLAKFVKAKVKIGVPGMREFSNLLIKEVYPQSANLNAMLRNLEPIRFLTGKNYRPEINIKVNANVDKILRDSKISREFISLIPFARGKGKDWSIYNYHKLINLIKNKYFDMQILVLGAIKDFGKINSDNVVDLCGKTSIEELAAVLLKSKVNVGADTGPMHLSAVLQVPSVFIFRASDANKTFPYIGKFSLFWNKNSHEDVDCCVKPNDVFIEIKKWIK
ncbi:MAG: glycosyltransferase family 9 protein [Endomicrobium sp.]|jgi:ADP-heptose:LPS heptosyltransferase|nr:glycosyltransferase family 9 protein [Endomicrobium sp.]